VNTLTSDNSEGSSPLNNLANDTHVTALKCASNQLHNNKHTDKSENHISKFENKKHILLRKESNHHHHHHHHQQSSNKKRRLSSGSQNKKHPLNLNLNGLQHHPQECGQRLLTFYFSSC
jgi:hypothetical protein